MKVRKMNVLLLILASVILGAFGQIALKQGLNAVGRFELKDLLTSRAFSLVKEKFILLGIVLYVLATAIWLVVLSQEELSFAYPLIGIGYILVAILGKILFNENLTFFRIFGIVLIVLGVYFIVSRI
jgi:multidrug transporter EmrE-like cation transporter